MLDWIAENDNEQLLFLMQRIIVYSVSKYNISFVLFFYFYNVQKIWRSIYFESKLKSVNFFIKNMSQRFIAIAINEMLTLQTQEIK